MLFQISTSATRKYHHVVLMETAEIQTADTAAIARKGIAGEDCPIPALVCTSHSRRDDLIYQITMRQHIVSEQIIIADDGQDNFAGV